MHFLREYMECNFIRVDAHVLPDVSSLASICLRVRNVDVGVVRSGGVAQPIAEMNIDKFTMSAEEIEKVLGCKPFPNPVLVLLGQLKEAARSAIPKEHVSELSSLEKVALCFMAGVEMETPPYNESPDQFGQQHTFTLRTKRAVGMYKLDGKWVVLVEAREISP